MKFFVKDCCKTVQARVVIFGQQVDNDVLYRGSRTSLLMLILPCILKNDPRFEKVGGILVYICL